MFVAWHDPEDGWQAGVIWHSVGSGQATWVPAAHVPDWHVSVRVQKFPSLQVLPLTALGFEHAPVDGLHTPGS